MGKKTKKKRRNHSHQWTEKVHYKLKGNELIPRSKCPSTMVSLEFPKKRMESKRTKREFVRLLNSKFAPSTIQPTNDYYTFINYSWLKHISLTEQQKYIVQIDDFRLTQQKVYEELNAMVKQYIREEAPRSAFARNMRNYFTSVVARNAPSNSRKLAKEVVALVEQLRRTETLPWKILAHFNKYRYCKFRCPFEFTIAPDDKESRVFRLHLSSHTFDILDVQVYYDDPKDSRSTARYKKHYRQTYRRFCRRLFDTVLGSGHGYDTDSIYDVEVAIFTALGCSDPLVSAKEDEESYHKVSKETVEQKFGFHLSEFCKELGFERTPAQVIVSSLSYLKCGTDLLVKEWKSEAWRAYWIYIQIASYCRFTRKWRHLYFEFFGKFQRGQQKIFEEEDSVSIALYMTMPYNRFLSEKYVEKYADPSILNYVEVLSKDLLAVFKTIIRANSWLQPSTKAAALHKLDKLSFTIGFPSEIPSDPPLTYEKHAFIANLDKISLYYTKMYIDMEGGTVIEMPDVDWTNYPFKFIGNQSYIVNASYTPSRNGIYINLGYLQKPFIDLDERGIEYNLAHIGYTLAHEMSHCLDDWGSKYDAEGNLSDWWTPKDKRKFAEIQKDVIRQYEAFAARDGIRFDASIGIGEDLADISGLAICDQYLRDFQNKNKDIIPIRRKSFETFYIYFAFQQRQKVAKAALAAQLKTNPHPLGKYRCNIPLSRSTIFRGSYNVKSGDHMWWHNTNMVWSDE
jgi:putative endopeptidase